MTATSVYIISCGDSIKIGVSNDPARRVKDMQTGMSELPVLYGSKAFPTRKAAYAVERRMHWTFRTRRGRGEWFHVSPAEALAKLKRLQAPTEETMQREVAEAWEVIINQPADMFRKA